MADTISALIMPTAGSHLSIYQSVSYPEIHFGNHSRKSSAHAECTKATKYLPMKTPPIAVVLFLLIVGSMLPMRASAQPDLEQRVTRLEHKAAADEGVGMAVFVSAAFCALWAQNTGRNAWLWFFLGLFLSVIAVFVLLYKNANDRRAGMK